MWQRQRGEALEATPLLSFCEQSVYIEEILVLTAKDISGVSMTGDGNQE